MNLLHNKIKCLILLILLLFYSACISGRVSGTLGKGKPNIQTTVEFPIKIEVKEENLETKGELSSQIQQNMTKKEVRDKVGKPHHIVGQSDPLYVEEEWDQKEKYGYLLEIWYYLYPENFIVYFKNGKVSGIKYLGESEPLLQEKEQPKI